jgi:hypothetical protein
MEGPGAGAGALPWLSAGLAASLAGAGAGVSRCSLEQMLVACTLNTRISNAPSKTKWTSWQHFKRGFNFQMSPSQNPPPYIHSSVVGILVKG